MQSAAEYAVRAAIAPLYADPTVDESGRIVQEKYEKVGPLEERTTYLKSNSVGQITKPYPAADRLLRPYLNPAGGTSR